MPSTPNVKILVADDEKASRMALEIPLRLSGYEVTTASGGREAIALARERRFDVALVDIYMPDLNGLEVLHTLREIDPRLRVIVLTAQGSLEIALRAIEEGAFEFIAKPYAIEEMLALVERAAGHPLIQSVPTPAPEPSISALGSASGLIGHSPAMVRAYKLTAQAARSHATVLIEGESGTGKELIARALHRHSARANHPFTAVNCSALTETLLESELFGYTRGSFTGAQADRAGLFESTEKGTIFLDELAGTSASFQASLLRVLQEKEVRRVGSREARPIDVRVIGATNRNLEELVAREQFRADLFYRLGVLTIQLPPLRERGPEDIALLIHHFLRGHSRQRGDEIRLSETALDLLGRYPWPGNVRELENTIAHAAAVCNTSLITVDDLPPRVVERVLPASPAKPRAVSLIDDRPTLAELDRRYAQLILSETEGNKSRAAEILGIDRRTIYRLLEMPEAAE